MSNIGLKSNTYYVTGKYLNLLNDFVVKVKNHPDTIDVNKKADVVNFFTAISNSENLEPRYQLLSSIIERSLREQSIKYNLFLSNLLAELNKDEMNAALSKVELIIEALDNEHFEALAKIKGEQ